MSAGAFTITSRGLDVAGASDQFTFVGRRAPGDVTLVARIAFLQRTNRWSLAGLMIRDSMNPNSKHVSLFVTPTRGLVVRSRADGQSDTVQMTVGSEAAPVWLRLERRSKVVTAYKSADGVSWSSLASVTLSLNTRVNVGLAVASRSPTASATANVDGVSLNGIPVAGPPPPTGNAPPAVSLNAPAGGTTYAAPATVAMGAAASDSDGSVARVDFYAGNERVGTDTSSPFAFSWGNVPAGSYVLRAVAVDDAGASAASNTVTVTVGANNPPLVSLTSPQAGTSFTAPASIALTASASDSDGVVKRVDFYNGGTLLSSDQSRPFSFTWSNVPAGSYSLSAVARDDLGASSVSAWSDVTVGGGGGAMLSKAIFRPAVLLDLIQFYVLEIFVAGVNPDLAVPVATQNLGLPVAVGGECTVDVRSTIAGLAPGNYVATVSSVSLLGGRLRSNTFPFTR
jgi:regulation of enolase protein 1 (concanavalin A-like superfamily)